MIQFLVIMMLALLLFSCVSIILFGDDKNFQNLFEVIIMYLEFSLGAWDLTKYDNVSVGKYVGRIFAVLYLILTVVLFLNFLIAILSSTFAKYENQKLGLYYEVIISKFSRYENDETYGSIICASPPLNILVYPF